MFTTMSEEELDEMAAALIENMTAVDIDRLFNKVCDILCIDAEDDGQPDEQKEWQDFEGPEDRYLDSMMEERYELDF